MDKKLLNLIDKLSQELPYINNALTMITNHWKKHKKEEYPSTPLEFDKVETIKQELTEGVRIINNIIERKIC